MATSCPPAPRFEQWPELPKPGPTDTGLEDIVGTRTGTAILVYPPDTTMTLALTSLPRHLLGAVLLTTFTCAPLAAQTRPGQYAPADIQYGASIFAAQCTYCHGPAGDAIPGVDLKSGTFKRASNDGELNRILTNGIPGTAMPPFTFTPPELTAMVAFLRSRGEVGGGAALLGDATRGKTVFEGSGTCTSCHRTNGQGPRLAPDLTDIGALRSADALQRALLDPAGSLQPVNRRIRVVTRDGRTLTGRRLNEDTYTVQLIDEQERLVSFVKSDLKEFSLVPGAAMPSFKDKLSDAQIADVLAYLLSLKGH